MNMNVNPPLSAGCISKISCIRLGKKFISNKMNDVIRYSEM